MCHQNIASTPTHPTPLLPLYTPTHIPQAERSRESHTMPRTNPTSILTHSLFRPQLSVNYKYRFHYCFSIYTSIKNQNLKPLQAHHHTRRHTHPHQRHTPNPTCHISHNLIFLFFMRSFILSNFPNGLAPPNLSSTHKSILTHPQYSL